MKRYSGLIILLCVSGMLLAVSALYRPAWYDDAGHFIVAREISQSGRFCYPAGPDSLSCDAASQFISMGPALAYPAGAFISATGADIFTIRWMMVPLAVLCLLVFWWLGKSLMSGDKATWAVALVACNIQFIGYGADFLAEVPALLWLFAGMWFFIRMVRYNGAGMVWWMLNCFTLAVLTKETVLPPLVISLALIALVLWRRKQRSAAAASVFAALFLPGAVLASYWLRTGSPEALMEFLSERSSYQSEFFAFQFSESLRFLALKPLIWLGMVAMALKVWTRRDPADVFLLLFQSLFFILFLCSAGYDRIGFMLIFLPAFYLSEFVMLIWNKMATSRKVWALRSIFLLVFAAVFVQQTPLILFSQFSHRQEMNAAERCMAEVIHRNGISQVFTYDQQLIPFLSPDVKCRLEPHVPHAAEKAQALVLSGDEVFIEGFYGRFIYSRSHAGPSWTIEETCDSGDWRYELKRR